MKRTVLLVEDEADTRDLLSRAIGREGWGCITAAGPDAALTLARASVAIDVVVTDVVMGGDDRAGLRLLAALREARVFAPVVVITAFADVEKVKVALNEGAAHLLEKPFRAAELVAAIARVCLRHGNATHAAEEFLSRAHLTDKEHSVALRVLQGLSSGEIAAVENNSEKTIRQHLTQIYAKCGVTSRSEFFRKVHTLGG